MNEIYGVDPLAPHDIKDLKALLTRFGLAHGRFIARYPKGWENELIHSFANLPELEKCRLMRLIQLHKDAFLSSDAPFNLTKSWSKNVAELRGRDRHFHKILAKKPNNEDFQTLDNYLWEDQDDTSSRGAFIEMSPESYANACAPLFECSSEVHISDRFFQLRDHTGALNRKRWKVLRALIDRAAKSSKCREFTLHFELPNGLTKKKFEERIEIDLADLAQEYEFNFSSYIHLAMQHGRYIFSIYGGLQFDHGLELNSGEKNHVHWLSSSELEHLHIRYGIACNS